MPTSTLIASLLLLSPPPAEVPVATEASLARHFGELDGCFVLQNLATDERITVNEARCAEALPPCSTFKIPHAVLALETGVVADQHTMFTWDGTPQHIKSWQRDHTLASAIDNSVVWYFQECARRIGLERMREMVAQLNYGNTAIEEPVDRFWLGDGSLRISANEQVEFLTRLYRDELPVQGRSSTLVRELIVQGGAFDFDGRFSGKTGSDWIDGRWIMGWFVGSVEHNGERSVFATNIRGEDDASGMRAREMTVAILQDLGLLEKKTTTTVDAGQSAK